LAIGYYLLAAANLGAVSATVPKLILPTSFSLVNQLSAFFSTCDQEL